MTSTRELEQFSEPRLHEWTARTRTPLDMLALCTIWFSIIPISQMLHFTHAGIWLIARAALSAVYGIDIAVRAVLSRRPMRYITKHPFGVLAAIYPPVRVVFSLRLLNEMFRKGNLARFLLVAFLLVLNGAILVVIFERGAPGATITSLSIALWWTACTVSTVGYGDYTPVTMAGRLVAVCIMVVGLTTVAVITAQIASSFMDQAAVRRAADADAGPEPEPEPATVDAVPPTDDELERHRTIISGLARIEELLRDDD